MSALGNQGGPFSPSSFQYQLNASAGTIAYSISGMPSWLNVSSASGTLSMSPTTVNVSTNSLVIGTFSGTINFTNTTNGQGNQARNAALQVNYNSTSSAAASGKRRRRF